MEESRIMGKAELFRRYLTFGISLFIIACGISVITRSDLGTSPITSVPYVASLNTPISIGSYFFSFYNCTDHPATFITRQERNHGTENGITHAISRSICTLLFY